jgi:hypothetical protein
MWTSDVMQLDELRQFPRSFRLNRLLHIIAKQVTVIVCISCTTVLKKTNMNTVLAVDSCLNFRTSENVLHRSLALACNRALPYTVHSS